MGTKLTLPAAALLSATVLGCHTSWDIAPPSLTALDGFREGQTRELSRLDDGKKIPFTSDMELVFGLRDGTEAAAKYRSIDVRGSLLTGIEQEYGQRVGVDLSRVTTVEMKKLSVGKTVALVTSLTLGAPLLTVVSLVVVGTYYNN